MKMIGLVPAKVKFSHEESVELVRGINFIGVGKWKRFFDSSWVKI